MADGSCVVAADVGSSAVRVAAVDPSGRVLAESRAERDDGTAGGLFDPERLWQCTSRCLAEVTSRVNGTVVSAVAVVGHVGTVFVDAAGEVIGDGRGWADSSGISDLEAALGSTTNRSLLDRAGRPSVTGGALAALLHLRQLDPEAFTRVDAVLQPKDFLLLRLTGVRTTDHTSAAYTVASDIRDRAWSIPMLDSLGLDPDVFPDQAPSTAVVGSVSPAGSRSTGLPVGAQVAAGGPDGSTGAAVVLGTSRDRVADVAGTTDVVVRVTDAPPADSRGAVVNPYLLGGSWTVGGATGSTGGAVGWWTSLLQLGTPADALEKLWPDVEAAGPGARGLLMDPCLSGSRFPRWNPSTRGRVLGLTSDHGPAEILRASLEAAAFVVRDGIERLVSPDEEVDVVLAGGVARSAQIAQLRANVLGRRVRVWSVPDVSLRGAALLAHASTGRRDLDELSESMLGTSRSFEPEQRAHARYDEIFLEWLSQLAYAGPSG
jgi:xylulokinase